MECEVVNMNVVALARLPIGLYRPPHERILCEQFSTKMPLPESRFKQTLRQRTGAMISKSAL